MNPQTFERFQGMWWGSIVGQAVANHNHSRRQMGIIDFPHQHWLVERRQIAQLLLQSPRLAEIKLATGGGNLLSLLSLIIFDDDNQNLLISIIGSEHLKLANLEETTDIRAEILDILIWNYLLTLVLSHKLESGTINFNLMLEKLFNNLNHLEIDATATLLTQKFKLVVEAINSGISLHNLLDKLSSNGNTKSTAIALSWYCFLTSPQDFKISVQRAASIPNVGGLTAALTSTLSGAYNGITGIPYNWRIRMSQNLNYTLENQLVSQLFKAWLGIYAIDGNQGLYNQKLDAVALSPMIQSRPTLKIISQKSRFN